MKRLLLLLLITILGNALSAQKTKAIKKKEGNDIFEKYSVLSSNKSIMHGTYYKYKKDGNKEINIEKGTYYQGRKIGEWNYGSKYIGGIIIKEVYNTTFQKSLEETAKKEVDTLYIHHYNLGQDELDEIKEFNKGALSYYEIQDAEGFRNYTYENGILKKYVINGMVYTHIKDHLYSAKKSAGNFSSNGKVENNVNQGVWHYKLIDVSKSTVNFKDGKKTGWAFSFYDNGDTLCKQFYSDSSVIISCTLFYENKDVFQTTVVDSINGTVIMKYFEGNKLHQKAIIRDGMLIELATFDKKGAKLKTANVANGEGFYQFYNIESGNLELVTSCQINKGRLNGTFTSHLMKQNRTKKFINGELQKEEKSDSKNPIYNDFPTYLLESAIEVEGTYIGGEQKLRQYVSTYFKMPQVAQELGISGNIYTHFAIKTDGSISQLKIINPPEYRLGYGLEEQCLFVITKTNGKWIPALRNGFLVSSYWTFPFEIDNVSGF